MMRGHPDFGAAPVEMRDHPPLCCPWPRGGRHLRSHRERRRGTFVNPEECAEVVRAFFVGLRQSPAHLGPELEAGLPRQGHGNPPTDHGVGTNGHHFLLRDVWRGVRGGEGPPETNMLLQLHGRLVVDLAALRRARAGPVAYRPQEGADDGTS